MLEKLTIIACTVDDSGITEMSGDQHTFKAMINPTSYSRNVGLKFTGGSDEDDDDDLPLDKPKPASRFKGAQAERLNFTFTLDGTGVVPDGGDLTVADHVDKLRKIACTYQGEKHEPYPVKVSWGAGLPAFFGRVTSMNTDYTLFRPDGMPVRASVTLQLIEAKTALEVSLEARQSSPDLTHLVQVRQADTLPLLCHRIYNDAAKYIDIARFNDLDGFGDLVPGTLLRFPPMR